MVSNRPSLTRNRSALLCAAAVFLVFAAALCAAPGDSAPELLSTTKGKGGAAWSDIAGLKKAADARNPKACLQYGETLLLGDGVPQDTAQAMMYLRQAADLGEPNAFFRLGKIFDDGEFTPKDYSKAFDCYTTAAKAGVAEAQYNLGVMYTSAHGVKRDFVEGLAWLIVATKNGASADGEKQVRERLQQTSRQQQITAAEQRATEILKAAAAVTVPSATSAAASAPQKPQAPAKIDLGDAAAPEKIAIAPPAQPLPDLGKNIGESLLSVRTQSPVVSPAEAENKDSQPKK